MSNCRHVLAFCVATLVSCGTALAQQSPQNVHFNVVVTKASGQYVTDLKQQDFTILDNGLTQPIKSFSARQIGEDLFQYEITFDTPGSERPNQYHAVEVKVDKPGLVVRTRKGYYAQP
jgi:hypothetical protein